MLGFKWLPRARGFQGCRLLVIALLAILLVGIPAQSEARPESARDRLDRAVDIYEHGGYLEASALLTNLLYPLRLTDRKDIVRAKIYLGLCYYVLNQQNSAAEEFRGVFRLDPSWVPDPLYLPAELIAFIEKQRPVAPPQRSTQAPGLGETLVQVPSRPFHFSPWTLVPLGVPQLRVKAYGAGFGFMGAELALLTMNVSSYWYLRYYEGTTNSGDLYAWRLGAKIVNISSFSLLVATLAYGMGDAMSRYRPPAPVSLSLEPLPGGALVSGQLRF